MMLPPAAQTSLDRIETMLDEAERFGLDALGANEDAFALRETRERYVPETLAAYERIPPSARALADPQSGKTPDDLLVEQLSILERSTAQRLARLAQTSRTMLSANGRFLVERLGDEQSLPEAPSLPAFDRPRLLARRFVDALGGPAGARPLDLVDAAASKLEQAFPLLVQTERGIFGSGPARRVAITVPVGNDRLRYALGVARDGSIESTCTKIVRGVAIRSETVPLEEWARGLFEDLSAYAGTNARATEILSSLLR